LASADEALLAKREKKTTGLFFVVYLNDYPEEKGESYPDPLVIAYRAKAKTHYKSYKPDFLRTPEADLKAAKEIILSKFDKDISKFTSPALSETSKITYCNKVLVAQKVKGITVAQGAGYQFKMQASPITLSLKT